MKAYKAFAPATISNFCSGFDLIGVALNEWGDEVLVRPHPHPGVIISRISGYGSDISKDQNSARTAVQSLLSAVGQEGIGLELEIHKGYLHSSGLGSSAASAVAAVVAANAVLGKPFKQNIDLYPFALAGERHLDPTLPADNVAASLLGGIMLSHPAHDPVRIPHPSGLHLVIYRPENARIATSAERTRLKPPPSIPVAVEQTHHIASLILGLYQSNWDLIRMGLQDSWITPQRAPGIPHFSSFYRLSLGHGALGSGISGSGPATFAVFMNSTDAESFADEWFHVEHAPSSSMRDEVLLVSQINSIGAYLC